MPGLVRPVKEDNGRGVEIRLLTLPFCTRISFLWLWWLATTMGLGIFLGPFLLGDELLLPIQDDRGLYW